MASPDDGTFPHNYLSTSPAHGVPGQSFLYAGPLRSPTPILLELPIPAPKSRERYAGYVWNAGVVLADKIAEGEIPVEGKKVLELGCGLGLPGIVAARMEADKVVLSDYDDPTALQDTRHAVEEALPPALRGRCTVVGHTWGESIAPILSLCHWTSYDLILLADCVWNRRLHSALIHSLRALLEASSTATVVHFSAGFHTGRAPVGEFLSRARAAGIGPAAPEEWKELSVEGESRPWNWGEEEEEGKGKAFGRVASFSGRMRAEEERQEERNRWTLYGTLRLLEP
ncbi:hypothetical protein JCM10908_001340 [Rhodotorula pacifica]|uniref:uncharacterized protein n=1 Tax=Rhodotorula pacifica TaxID=1495444 RepID=UPI00318093BF